MTDDIYFDFFYIGIVRFEKCDNVVHQNRFVTRTTFYVTIYIFRTSLKSETQIVHKWYTIPLLNQTCHYFKVGIK